MNKDKENTQFLGECTCGEIYTKRNLVAPDCVKCNYEEEVLSAMEQQAVDFEQWRYDNHWQNIDRDIFWNGVPPIQLNKKTTQELYQLFNQQN